MALELTEEQVKAGWTTRTLEDSLNLIIDHRGKTPKKMGGDWSETGHRVISAINMKNRGVDSNDHHYVDDEIYSKWMKNPVEIGDVFLTSEAPMGAVAYISKAESTSWVVGQRIYALRADKEHLDGRYLYYLLQSRDIQEQLVARSSGTTVIGIKQAELRQIVLRLPPLVEQKRVAEILGSLDDKIEANSRLLDSLYQLLREVYSYEISKNSDVVLLTDIADFMNGKAFTKDATGTGRMVVRIAELNNGPGASTVYNDVDNVDEKHLVNAGELLMSWSGSLGVFLWSREEAIVNQHIFKVIPKPRYSRAVVYCALESVIEDFQAIAKDKATTMGHIKRGDLETEIKIPSSTSEIEAVFSQISVLERENIALAETRDLLIRQLIN